MGCPAKDLTLLKLFRTLECKADNCSGGATSL